MTQTHRLKVTKIKNYSHPLGLGEVIIADSPGVWPPYSAFHLAERGFSVAIDLIKKDRRHRPIIADIGTGSGILAIIAKQMIPSAICIATDLSSQAVALTRYNWQLNNLPTDDLITLVADGIDSNLISLAKVWGGIDILIANLPQQPLVNGYDLARLRETDAAAWNIDPSRDPDGLGVFVSVLSRSHQVVKQGGVALVSASSKQNWLRIKNFLESLVNSGKIKRWHLISRAHFSIPASYDPALIIHWRKMEEKDGVQRLFDGPDGPQYEHYNIAINF